MSKVDNIVRQEFYKTLIRFKIMKEPELYFNGSLSMSYIEEMNKIIYGQFGKQSQIAVDPGVFNGLMDQLKDE